MDISWDIVVTGLVCTCIGLLAGWGRYHGKVGLLRMEIKVPTLAQWYVIGFVSVGTWELGRWLGNVLWRLWS